MERKVFRRRDLCPGCYGAGKIADCAASGCTLWEPGAAADKGLCGLVQLDLVDRPMVAAWLHRERTQLSAYC